MTKLESILYIKDDLFELKKVNLLSIFDRYRTRTFTFETRFAMKSIFCYRISTNIEKFEKQKNKNVLNVLNNVFVTFLLLFCVTEYHFRSGIH